MSAAFSAADIESKVFKTVRFREGYEQAQVDDFLDECHGEVTARFARLARYDSTGSLAVRLTGTDVNNKLFSTTRIREGYDQMDVDDFLGLVRAGLDDLDQQLTERGVTVTRS